jgi:hypothetical protein
MKRNQSRAERGQGIPGQGAEIAKTQKEGKSLADGDKRESH